MSSEKLAGQIELAALSTSKATVIGFGNMGWHYVQGLQALGVGKIRVCSRSTEALERLRDVDGIETVAGGIEQLKCQHDVDELAIVATPIDTLIPVSESLIDLGFRRLLIEKPVSLWSKQIGRLSKKVERSGAIAVCGYNRLAYPSTIEVLARASDEGGVTSCRYNFTEMIREDWPSRFPAEELARWGIANSLHVISMAHGVIGLPETWQGHRSGRLSWHPTGAVFVGAGISEKDVPFSYHADWGSKGRWCVEVHTAASCYRLCPLEKVFRRVSGTGEWQAISLKVFAPEAKAGLVEQIAAMLDADVRRIVPLMSLEEAMMLTRFAERVFGYEEKVA